MNKYKLLQNLELVRTKQRILNAEGEEVLRNIQNQYAKKMNKLFVKEQVILDKLKTAK